MRKPNRQKRRLAGVCALVLALTACATSGPGDPMPAVRQFMAAIAAKDKARAEAVLTANAEFVLPYNPNGDASAAGIRRYPAPVYLSLAFDSYDNIVFPDPVFHIANNGMTVFVETTGDLRIARSGKPYRNRYVFRFDVYDGRIERVVEYANPVTVARDGVPAPLR